MTGRELLAALQALPPEHLDLPCMVYGDGIFALDTFAVYHGHLHRNTDVEDWTAVGAYSRIAVLAFDTESLP